MNSIRNKKIYYVIKKMALASVFLVFASSISASEGFSILNNIPVDELSNQEMEETKGQFNWLTYPIGYSSPPYPFYSSQQLLMSTPNVLMSPGGSSGSAMFINRLIGGPPPSSEYINTVNTYLNSPQSAEIMRIGDALRGQGPLQPNSYRPPSINTTSFLVNDINAALNPGGAYVPPRGARASGYGFNWCGVQIC